jgi:hypothetical protein
VSNIVLLVDYYNRYRYRYPPRWVAHTTKRESENA